MTFTCASCGQQFETTWSDEEAMAECRKNFSPIERKAGIAKVCSRCYEEFMKELKAHPEMRIN